MPRLGSLVLCALTVLGVVACSAMAEENVGQSSAALTLGAISSVPDFEQEMSADWSPSNPSSGEILVTGFNDKTNGESRFGWAWSDNNALSWNRCEAKNLSSCNSFGAFDQPGGPNWSWRGDPTVVTDRSGNAVYVMIADDGTYASGGKRVVAVVSPDGGRNFDGANATVINDVNCSDGKQDQPGASFDFSTNPPTLWIVWRHDGAGFYGACIRRYEISAPNHLQPLDAAQVVNVSPPLGEGIGAVRIQAGDGVVTVVYSDNDTASGCPTTALSHLAVKASSSLDMGHTWSQTMLYSSDSFASCVLSQQVSMGANVRNFDFVRAPDGTNYVIAQDTGSTLRLFMDRDGAGAEAIGNAPWREWCPGTLTAGPGSPTTNWTSAGLCSTPFYPRPQDPQGRSLAWPTIAADDRSRISVWFYEGDAADLTFHVHFKGKVDPRSAIATWVDSNPLSADITPTALDDRTLGDYEGMAVRNSLRQPQCGGAGTFFPVWTFSSSTDVFGQTREVSFP